ERVTRPAANFPGSGINYSPLLTSLEESTADNTTICNFVQVGFGPLAPVAADVLFLALPRRALEIVAAGSGDYMLNTPQVRYLLESSLDQPAVKVVMGFDGAWWQKGGQCKHPPRLVWVTDPPPPNVPPSQWVRGGTVTDL